MITHSNIFKDSVLPEIKRRRQNILDGNVNAIPFTFSKFSEHVYGIEHSRQYGITAPSGASKSKLSRDMFLFQPFDFYMKNKDKMDIDIRINMFCLEDSPTKVGMNLTSKLLWDKHGLRIPIKVLESQRDALDEDLLKKIESLGPYFEKFSEKVYMSSTTNPSVIKKEILSFLMHPSVGDIVDSKGNVLDNKIPRHKAHVKNGVGNIVETTLTDLQYYRHQGGQLYYKKKNPNLFVINIFDNLQAMDRGSNKYDTLDEFCRMTLRKELCEFYQCANVIVQQQNQGSRQIKKDMTGETMSDTLIPSIAGLGEFKNSVQTMHYLFGIYSPFNDGLDRFQKYDIKSLAWYYRYISILKSNYCPNFNFSVFADPIAETFKDLPSHKDTQGLKQVYQEIARLEGIGGNSTQNLI